MSSNTIENQVQLKKLKKSTPFSRILSKTLIYIVLILWGVTTVFPFVWLINNSVKKKNEIDINSFAPTTADTFTWDNFVKAFNTAVPVPRAFLNSIVISGTVTIMVILLSALCAFALTRYVFKLRGVLHSVLIAAMMFPSFSTIIPVYMMMSTVGLMNNILSVILPLIAGNIAFACIVLMGYIRGLPIELEEAAYLEGCNVFGILFKVVFPITKPAFATVAIFTFLWSYNELFLPMFLLRKNETYTINKLLQQISSREGGTDKGLMSAAACLIVVPVIIIYCFLQKYIIKGLTAGAVKG